MYNVDNLITPFFSCLNDSFVIIAWKKLEVKRFSLGFCKKKRPI